jgi:hypothetical protein
MSAALAPVRESCLTLRTSPDGGFGGVSTVARASLAAEALLVKSGSSGALS